MTPLEAVERLGGVLITVDGMLDCGMVPFKVLLSLEEGSVIPSTRSAGDNIDLHVGGRLFGYGEIVSMEGARGIRITNMKVIE